MSNSTTPIEIKIKTKYPPLPPHWKAPTMSHPVLGPLPLYLYRLLSLVSVQKLSLDQHWHSKCDDEIFKYERDQVIGQINNSNIVCGLILATTAAFITTSPPVSSILNYNNPAAYVFLVFSFVEAIGSIIAGTAVIAVYQSIERSWSRDVLTGTRFRLYSILILVAWPSISLFMSILSLMGALLISVLTPRRPWLDFLASVELLLWAWTLPFFILCTLPLRKQPSDEEAHNAREKPLPSRESSKDSAQSGSGLLGSGSPQRVCTA